MSKLPRADALEQLRADLRHFEESSDLGARDTVDDIKSRLRARILEVESELRAGIKDHKGNPPRRSAV
jgi:hypothetical protein